MKQSETQVQVAHQRPSSVGYSCVPVREFAGLGYHRDMQKKVAYNRFEACLSTERRFVKGTKERILSICIKKIFHFA
jgi:hypothetical protein